jgi:PGF-pre-PGF domain-containing protein
MLPKFGSNNSKWCEIMKIKYKIIILLLYLGVALINAAMAAEEGNTMQTWKWNVTSQSPSDIKSITVLPSDISVIRRGTMQLDIPTYDGSGQAVHPDIYYNANGWRGYKYWMVMTPYPNGDSAYENPSILVSNDGISWSVPQGLQNPIDPKPASGSNSDVDIVYNETADRIEIYYVESGAGTSYLMRRTSADGITWSAEKNTMLVPDYQVMSPAIIKNGSVYDMWYTGGANCNADTTVKFASSADGINWSSPQMVNIKSNLNIWHLDVSYIPSQNEYWMVYAAYPKGSTCGSTDLYFAKSTDKLNWTNYSDIIVKRGTSWDSSQIYRSTFVFNDISNTIRIWYSARGGTPWHIGYVEKQYFSAQAKDQYGQPVNVSIMWASSNVSVGTITSGGVFSALSPGMTTITASNGTVSGTAKVQVTDTSVPVQPSITSYLPASPLSDNEGATRTFNITANQTVNVTWYINGTSVQSTEKGVISAIYTNTSAAQGTWIVNATASNANGFVSREWTWTVTSPLIITITSPADNSENKTGDVRVTVNLSRDGTALLNWNGVNESMDGAGTSFYKNKTNLLSGNYTFRVFVNDSYGSIYSTGAMTVIVNLTNTTNLTSPIKQSPGNMGEGVIIISNPRSSGGSSGGGGGGGGSSGENYTNIEVIEKYDMQISKDSLTSYRFNHAKNPIMFVNITGNTSLGIITTSIEVLKNTSTLVNVSPEGLVYKNANIWVGTTGFATPKNIKEALIKFRINNDWMSTNGVLASDIVLVKWDGTSWIKLDTKVLSKDDTNTYFEGKTNAFSPFAIVAKTALVAKPAVTTNPVGTPVITAIGAPESTKKAPGFAIVLALVGLTALVLRKRTW